MSCTNMKKKTCDCGENFSPQTVEKTPWPKISKFSNDHF